MRTWCELWTQGCVLTRALEPIAGCALYTPSSLLTIHASSYLDLSLPQVERHWLASSAICRDKIITRRLKLETLERCNVGLIICRESATGRIPVDLLIIKDL